MLFHCRDVPQFIVNNAVVNIFLHLYVFSFRINFQKWNSYVTSYEHFSVSSYLLPNCPAEGIFVSIYVSTSSIWECSFHHFLIYNLIVCLFIRGEKGILWLFYVFSFKNSSYDLSLHAFIVLFLLFVIYSNLSVSLNMWDQEVIPYFWWKIQKLPLVIYHIKPEFIL